MCEREKKRKGKTDLFLPNNHTKPSLITTCLPLTASYKLTQLKTKKWSPGSFQPVSLSSPRNTVAPKCPGGSVRLCGAPTPCWALWELMSIISASLAHFTVQSRDALIQFLHFSFKIDSKYICFVIMIIIMCKVTQSCTKPRAALLISCFKKAFDL